MQSTGQTSTHASHPVQPSAWITAKIFGTTLRGLPAIDLPAIRSCSVLLCCLTAYLVPVLVKPITSPFAPQKAKLHNDYRFQAYSGQAQDKPHSSSQAF